MKNWFIAVGAFALLLPLNASADTLGCVTGPPVVCHGTGGYNPDIYALNINNGAAFKASTLGSSFDTQLFLFNSIGQGLWSNDEESSAIDLGASISAAQAAAQGDPWTPGPGLYYLVVSAWPRGPMSGGSLIFPFPAGVDRMEKPVAGAGLFNIANPEFQAGYPILPPNNTYTLTFAGLDSAAAFGTVPEPASLTLLGTGIVGLLGRAWRRRRTASSVAV